jgi:hypothetical protein
MSIVLTTFSLTDQYILDVDFYNYGTFDNYNFNTFDYYKFSTDSLSGIYAHY